MYNYILFAFCGRLGCDTVLWSGTWVLMTGGTVLLCCGFNPEVLYLPD